MLLLLYALISCVAAYILPLFLYFLALSSQYFSENVLYTCFTNFLLYTCLQINEEMASSKRGSTKILLAKGTVHKNLKLFGTKSR